MMMNPMMVVGVGALCRATFALNQRGGRLPAPAGLPPAALVQARPAVWHCSLTTLAAPRQPRCPSRWASLATRPTRPKATTPATTTP
jgi:hypothetical protein